MNKMTLFLGSEANSTMAFTFSSREPTMPEPAMMLVTGNS